MSQKTGVKSLIDSSLDPFEISRIYSSLRSLSWVQISTEGLIVAASPSFQKTLGYSAAELENINFSTLFCPTERKEELPEAHSILAASQEEYHSLAHLLRKNGVPVPVVLLYKGIVGASVEREGLVQHSAVNFRGPMFVLAFEIPRESEREWLLAEYRIKTADCDKERCRLIHSLTCQLGPPLAAMALSARVLCGCLNKMTSQERIEEIYRLKEKIEICQKTLKKALLQIRA